MECLRCILILIVSFLLLGGCSTLHTGEQPAGGRHIVIAEKPQLTHAPPIIQHIPLIPPLEYHHELERYTVSVFDVPIREFLFALSRDTALNIDIHPEITGLVTINAVNQTLPQILTRLTRQNPIRWHFQPPNLSIVPDAPFLKTYEIDYVNVSRRSTGTVSVSNSVAATGTLSIGNDGGGVASGNDSTTHMQQQSSNLFWETMIANLRVILEEDINSSALSRNILVNPENGLVSIRATAAQHDEIRLFLNTVVARALKQVLIEATVVEVTLNDTFQMGIDWSAFRLGNASIAGVEQSVIGANFAASPLTTMVMSRTTSQSDLGLTVKMLEQFGNIKVLSTPRVMTLNNQTAVLKVVDNIVYFSVKIVAEVHNVGDNQVIVHRYETGIKTAPVGFVMTVTPQISANNLVTLNIRPTISRIIGYSTDPNPDLASASVTNLVPDIQVREIESILRIQSGEVAVLGGLMQDTINNDVAGVPILSRLPFLGSVFSYQSDQKSKTELVIFIRPIVVQHAGHGETLPYFAEYLKNATTADREPRKEP